MALYDQLPVYKVSYDLLSLLLDICPNISRKSKCHIREDIRSWQLCKKKSFIELGTQTKASVRGWLNYYGKFYPSSLKSMLQAPLVPICNRCAAEGTIYKIKFF